MPSLLAYAGIPYQVFGMRSGAANLDEGAMWPTSYALTKLTDDDEARIAELVKKACLPAGRR